MKQPVFFISDPNRKEDFVLETKIWKENGSLISEKRTSSPQSAPHLTKMIESYKLLSKLKDLNKQVSVARAYKENDSVRFDYISGNSAERILLEAILDKNDSATRGVINKLIASIESLSTVEQDPLSHPKYASVFGNTYSGKTKCSEIGLIDLNFDNFIIDKYNHWHLIDYEWVFDFPVSQRFLIQRALWYFIYRHQETFRYHSERLACVAIARNILVPSAVYVCCEAYFKNLRELMKAESCFQKYVMGKAYMPKPDFEFYENPSPAKKITEGMDSLIAGANKAEREIPELTATVERLKQEKLKLKREKDRLENENKAIVSSRSYKIAKKITKIKRVLP